MNNHATFFSLRTRILIFIFVWTTNKSIFALLNQIENGTFFNGCPRSLRGPKLIVLNILKPAK